MANLNDLFLLCKLVNHQILCAFHFDDTSPGIESTWKEFYVFMFYVNFIINCHVLFCSPFLGTERLGDMYIKHGKLSIARNSEPKWAVFIFVTRQHTCQPVNKASV